DDSRRARAGDAVAGEARGVRPQACRGDELRGDGRDDRRAHSDAEDAGAPGAGGVVGSDEGAPMNELDPRIHQVLDGELPLESLPPELRATVLRQLAVQALVDS